MSTSHKSIIDEVSISKLPLVYKGTRMLVIDTADGHLSTRLTIL